MSSLTTIPMPINQIFEPIQKAEVKPVEEIVKAEVEPIEQIAEAEPLDIDLLVHERNKAKLLKNKEDKFNELKLLWEKEMPGKDFDETFDPDKNIVVWNNKIFHLSTKNKRDKEAEELKNIKLNEKDEKTIQKNKDAEEEENIKKIKKQDKFNKMNESYKINNEKRIEKII